MCQNAHTPHVVKYIKISRKKFIANRNMTEILHTFIITKVESLNNYQIQRIDMLGMSLLIGFSFFFCGMILNQQYKKREDLNKYVIIQRNGLFIMGSINIFSGIVSEIMELDDIYAITFYTTFLFGILFIVYTEHKISNNISRFKVDKKIVFISSGIILLLFLLVLGTMKEPKVRIEYDELIINGLYGERIKLDHIKSVKLIDKLPPIKYRTNGVALGKVAVGYFSLETNETIKCFIYTDNLYVEIETPSMRYYINSKDSVQTREYYFLLVKRLR